MRRSSAGGRPPELDVGTTGGLKPRVPMTDNSSVSPAAVYRPGLALVTVAPPPEPVSAWTESSFGRHRWGRAANTRTVISATSPTAFTLTSRSR
ncbi:hypothetical protein ACFPM0_21900 [Pseudonocardia sulfidoxydans]|uniref:hypothetical protein n=1 Tax=Pseudonocardia sulfidoxydans TaxID=54011 RepID=UPI0036238ED1